MNVKHVKMGLPNETGGRPTMPDTPAKKKWDRENSVVFSVKLMNKTEADIIQYLDCQLANGVGKGTVIKKALREYIANHPINNQEDTTK